MGRSTCGALRMGVGAFALTAAILVGGCDDGERGGTMEVDALDASSERAEACSSLGIVVAHPAEAAAHCPCFDGAWWFEESMLCHLDQCAVEIDCATMCGSFDANAETGFAALQTCVGSYPCADDSDCTAGVCVGESASSAGACSSGAVGASCVDDADCPGLHCVDDAIGGRCESGVVGSRCNEDADCAPGGHCVAETYSSTGVMVCSTGADGEPCHDAADCLSEQCIYAGGGTFAVCVSGAQGDPCLADDDCDSGFCFDSSIWGDLLGECTSGDLGAHCSEEADCASGYCWRHPSSHVGSCVAGAEGDPCYDEGDCATGHCAGLNPPDGQGSCAAAP